MYPLGDLPGVASVTYGVVSPGPHEPGGVALLRAGDIAGGTVDRSNPMRISGEVHERHIRTALTPGDLVVVLVGRIGDAAVVGEELAGWNAARSVGIITFTDEGRAHGIGRWLLWWLRMPEARDWCAAHSAGSAHSTLSISTLRQLNVPLPPPEPRNRLLRTMSLVEQRIAINARIAGCAVELADLHFTRSEQGGGGLSRCAVSDVSDVINGVLREKSPETAGTEGVAWAAPSEVLQSPLPHVDRTSQRTWTHPDAVCAPGVLLIAPRPGEVKTVVSGIPVVPGRGLLALRTADETDRMWMLHALRSRSHELVSTAQGAQAREMRLKAFSRWNVPWPGSAVRRSFARIAGPLHERACAAVSENRALEALIAAELAEVLHAPSVGSALKGTGDPAHAAS
ncbi:hypothetical protein ACIODT_25100 [Streptomyces sp. NPDC088251]|uniref:hypothetical protein n=1 Tax=unclassified Streptomyces TaxID=2593676 RepID=UPI003825311F